VRPPEDWTDRVYREGSELAHLKPFGDAQLTLCRIEARVGSVVWLGTGCWDEIETAQSMTLCGACQVAATE
jgi:hypothetical protein